MMRLFRAGVQAVLTAAALAATPSCSEKEQDGAKAAEDMLEIRIENAPPTVRAQAVSADPEDISSVSLAAYSDEGLLEACSFLSGRQDATLLLDRSRGHTLAAIANMGDMTSRFPATLAELEAMTVSLGWDAVNSEGVPMTGMLTVSRGAESATIRLKRLLAKVTLSLDTAWPDNTDFDLKEIRVGNTNSSVGLFRNSAAKTSEDLIPGDWTNTLAEEMTFFLPENMQGVLLPENTDPYQKTPESLAAAGLDGKAGLCSYMDIVLTQKDTYGVSGDRRFRFYIGSDNTGDFNVERNTEYRINFGVTLDGMNLKGNWKVDASGTTDTRSLAFSKPIYAAPAGKRIYIPVNYSSGGVHDSGYSAFNAAGGWSFCGSGLDKIALGAAQEGKGIAVTVSGSVSVGDEIPLEIKTFDGQLSDSAALRVISGDMDITWDSGFIPSYIAQKGTVRASIPPGYDCLEFKPEEESRTLLEMTGGSDGTSATVALIGAGTAKIAVYGKNASGTDEIGSVDLIIQAPTLSASPADLPVAADGSGTVLVPVYRSKDGKIMKPGTASGKLIFDKLLYDRLLAVDYSFSENDAGQFLAVSDGSVHVGKMSAGGLSVLDFCGAGHEGTVTMSPKGAYRFISPVSVPCRISDPFPDAAETRLLAIINNKYDGAMGSVVSSALDVDRKGSGVTVPLTVADVDDALVELTSEIPDMTMALSGGKIILSGIFTDGKYSAGKYVLYAALKNRKSGEVSPRKAIGNVECHLMTGLTAHAESSLDDYNVSVSFANRFGLKQFAEMDSKLKSVKMFGFASSGTTRITTRYYVFDYAEDDNGVYISPESSDFMTWGSWCDVDAYDASQLKGCGERIYSHHIGLTDSNQWAASGENFFSMCSPQVTADISKVTGVSTGLKYAASANYRIYYTASDTEKGSTGLPYHLIGLPTSSKTAMPIPWDVNSGK